MAPFHQCSFRLIVAYAIGYMAPMAALWFVAPIVAELAKARGWRQSGWEFDWFVFVPYPVPFTGRAAAALALMFVPPVLFTLSWLVARRRARRRPW